MVIERHPLYLQFKGDRDYVQGPDIFDAVLERLQADTNGPITDIDFAFHRLARRAMDLVHGEQGKDLDPVAVCQYIAAGQRRRAYVVETDRAIEGRYPYPEHEVVSHLMIDKGQRACRLEANPAFSDIEIWVAMTKALHQAAFDELKGKWLFVRGRFARYDSKAQGPRELSIMANFNNKLTRSEAVLSGEKIGEIFFSIV